MTLTGGVQKTPWRTEDLLQRHLYFQATGFAGLVAEQGPGTQFLIPNARKIQNGVSHPAFEAAGACIYCGARTFVLGTSMKCHDEHIIPEGLGSLLVLPEASCRRCAQRTSQMEFEVLKEITPARLYLGIRRKRRKRSEVAFPIRTNVLERLEYLELPLSDHPATVLLPVLREPRVISLRDPSAPDLRGAWIYAAGKPEKVLSSGREFESAEMDVLRISQLIAKISHSYACAIFGKDGFEPFLASFIRRDFRRYTIFRDHFEWVGGVNKDDIAEEDSLHVLGHELVKIRTSVYIRIYVRLFANILGSPVYQCIVGKPT